MAKKKTTKKNSKRKLDILVPQYKEQDDVIKPLLDSIAIQQNVDMKDIGVIIVNDGTDVHLSDEFLNSYPFTVEYYKEEHRGVSGTRNACLDHSKAEYVMFCDADDMFCNVCGLYIIFREMELDGGFDSFVSVFVEEGRNPMNKKEVIYLNREMDSTFVHGKVHKRKYLLDKQIRWNDSLTIHEDSYFNILCQRLSDRVKYCPMPFYLWKWRDESVCRHDEKYILKTYNNMLDSNTALVNEFIRRKMLPEAQFYATMMIMDAYYTMNKDEWLNQDNQDYRNAVELRFKEYYRTFESFYKTIPMDIKMQIIQGVKNRMFGEGLMLETITFDQWIKHILEL